MIKPSSVAAFVLTITIILSAYLFGRGVLSLLVPHWHPLLRELLSPAFGLGMITLLTFSFSRLGFPVGNFARHELLAIMIFTAWCHRRPSVRQVPGEYKIFVSMLCLSLVLMAWPMWRYGFDWLSYANNDMVNYSLLAQRFLGYGFFDVPTIPEILSGKHYFLTFWLQGIVERAGAELLLATVSGVTGLFTIHCFMPLILAAHLASASAAAALVFADSRKLLPTSLTLACLTIAPLFCFGTMYQLFGQTLGLGALCGALAVTRVGIESCTRGEALQAGFCLTFSLAILLVFYPELCPFYFFAAGLLVFRQFLTSERPGGEKVERQELVRQMVFLGLPVVCLVPILLRRYLLSAFSFLLLQAEHGVTGVSQAADVFQQYLQPSGLAGIWGLLNNYRPMGEPTLSVCIALGAILLIAACSLAMFEAVRGGVVGSALLAFFTAAALLQYKNSAFGLYKIAMYVQPFLWGTLAIHISEATKRRNIQIFALGLLLFFCARTQQEYVRASSGELTSGMNNEIYRASSTRLLNQLMQLSETLREKTVVSDTCNLVLAKIQAAVFSEVRATFPLADIYPTKNYLLHLPQAPELVPVQNDVNNALVARATPADFNFIQADGSSKRSEVRIETAIQPGQSESANYVLLRTPTIHTPFNRFSRSWDEEQFTLVPWSEVRNHLIFIDSTFARIYYSHERDRIALYQLEPDYFFPGRTMAAMGRRMVVETLRPTPGARLVLQVSASLKADGRNRLPEIAAIGETRTNFPVVGRGSARVFSEPLTAQNILGRNYLGLEMGEEGTVWKPERHGLMRLYGTEILDDPRRVTVFLRDLSLVSQEDFENRSAPTKIENFRADLLDPALEYSGIYEDGWGSEELFVVLSASANEAHLIASGMVPDMGDPKFSTEVTLWVDNEMVAQRTAPCGDFTFEETIPVRAGLRKVGLSFSHVQSLPNGDRRPVSAMLKKIQIGL